MPMTTQEIASLVDGELVGDPTVAVRDVQSIDKAGSGDLTFARDAANLERMTSSSVSAILVPTDLRECLPTTGDTAFILVDDPGSAFFRILGQFRSRRERCDIGISSQSFVSETAQIGKRTNIHPGAHVGEDVVIGDDCDIHPGVVIGAGCRLGNDVVLHPHVVLYPDVVLGNRVIIHAASVLGGDGFGYRQVEGRHVRIPHFGTVMVADDVEIGVSTAIDRSITGATTIGEGTKIDNLVVVAHNCEIGKHNLLVSHVGLAGSVTTGDYVVCAGQAGIADHVHLGDHCVVAAKTGVPKSLPGGQTYLGNPATQIEDARRQLMAVRRLPQMRKQVRELERQVATLTALLETLKPPLRRVSADQDDDTPAQDAAA